HQALPGELATPDHDEQGTDRTNTGRFSRREQVAINPANHQQEQQQDRTHTLQAADTFHPGAALARASQAGCHASGHHNRAYVQHHAQDARQYSRNEQLADVIAGQHAIDNQGHAGRDHGTQGAGRGNSAACQGIGIAVALHGGVRDPGHGGRRRKAGTAYGREHAARQHCGNGQTATTMTDKAISEIEQVFGDIRPCHQIAHQDEQRDDGQVVVMNQAIRGFRSHIGGRTPINYVSKATNTNQSHRYSDGYFQNHEHDQDDHASDNDSHYFSSASSSPSALNSAASVDRAHITAAK